MVTRCIDCGKEIRHGLTVQCGECAERGKERDRTAKRNRKRKRANHGYGDWPMLVSFVEACSRNPGKKKKGGNDGEI